MKSSIGNRQSAIPPDPEAQLQRDENLHGESWLFWLIAVLTFCWVAPRSVWRWLKWKRVCCWCNPPHRIAGSPLAWRVTHTACTLGQNNFWHRSPEGFGGSISPGRNGHSTTPTVSESPAVGKIFPTD